MHAQTGRHPTAYGQVRESRWQACLTGEEEDGGWWRGQRQREWQGEAEGKGQAATHEGGETLAVGRRQLEGTIKSPDTSVHIIAEHWDRRKAGRVEGAGWWGPRHYRTDRQVLKGVWGIEGDRPGADTRPSRDWAAAGWRCSSLPVGSLFDYSFNSCLCGPSSRSVLWWWCRWDSSSGKKPLSSSERTPLLVCFFNFTFIGDVILVQNPRVCPEMIWELGDDCGVEYFQIKPASSIQKRASQGVRWVLYNNTIIEDDSRFISLPPRFYIYESLIIVIIKFSQINETRHF